MIRKINKKSFIIFFLLLISIGFAYLSTNMSLLGTGIFKENSWDIYFSDLSEENYKTDITTVAAINNKTTINFSINLQQPQSTYTMYANIVNDGTIDAMLDSFTVTNTLDTNEEKVIDIKLTYADDIELTKYDLLKAESLDTIKVEVMYKDDILNSELLTTEGDLDFSVTLNYLQADEDAKERNYSIVEVTYDYNDVFDFNANEYMNTGYLVNWDSDFRIIENTTIKGSLESRYMFVGSYDGVGVTNFNVELSGKSHRVWIGSSSDRIDSQTSVKTSDFILKSEFYWNSNDKIFDAYLTGETTNLSLESYRNVTGNDTNTIRIGTTDYRGSTVFSPITVNSLSITRTVDSHSIYYLPTPVRSGYTFDGWYTDSSLTNKVQSTDKVTRDIVLYAKWI